MNARQRMHFQLLLFFLFLIVLLPGVIPFVPGMDGMTYASVAKRILSRHDWVHLFYTRDAYAEFFQHPPLGIWLQAGLMSVTGPTDFSLQLWSPIFAFGSIWLCLWLGRWRAKEWEGYIAALVLFTSIRFTKYSISFLLDPAMTFFCLLSFAAFWRGWFFRSGLAAALAFLCKGVPSVIVPLVVGAALVGDLREPARRRQALGGLGGLLAGYAIPMVAWFLFADGWNFLRQYLQISFIGRTRTAGVRINPLPLQNLLTFYWPWIPFYFYGVWTSFRELWTEGARLAPGLQSREARFYFLSSVISLGVLFAFTFFGFFLEHYLVLFYPFAALVVARPFARLVESRKAAVIGVSAALTVVYLLGAAYSRSKINPRTPEVACLQQAARQCTGIPIERLGIRDSVLEQWNALATGSWYTPWDVTSLGTDRWLDPLRSPASLILGLESDRRAALRQGWVPTSIQCGSVIVLEPVGASLCRQTDSGAP